MRIIDKNTDFYDYLQDIYRDDNLTLDRTDSFLLTKEAFKDGLSRGFRYCRDIDVKNPAYKFVLLQIGYTYWLFLIEITKIDGNDNITNYNVDLFSNWKNYNKTPCLISLMLIKFPYKILYGDDYRRFNNNKNYLIKKTPTITQAVNMGEYKIEHDYCFHRTHRFVKSKLVTEEKHFPLLKACDLSMLLDPLDVYLAFEEYLSSKKTSAERTSSIGITDKEKIENHGFDFKTSFKGKTN